MEDLIALNKQGQTIVMVTHSVRIASYGTRLLVLADQTFQEDAFIEGQSMEERREYVERLVRPYL